MTHDPDTVPGDDHQGRRAQVIAAGYRAAIKDELVLTDALLDPDASVRASAVLGLARARWLTPSQLIDALGDEDPVVRRVGVHVLDDFWERDPSFHLHGQLDEHLDDSDDLVVIAALGVVGAHGLGQHFDKVVALARSDRDALVVEEAIATAGELGDPRGLEVILEHAHAKPAIRRRVVVALSAFEGADVEAALDELANDRDWQVRQAVEMLRKAPLDPSA